MKWMKTAMVERIGCCYSSSPTLSRKNEEVSPQRALEGPLLFHVGDFLYGFCMEHPDSAQARNLRRPGYP